MITPEDNKKKAVTSIDITKKPIKSFYGKMVEGMPPETLVTVVHYQNSSLFLNNEG